MSHFTREHSESTRTGEKLGVYTYGFKRMIPRAQFEILQQRAHQQGHELPELSAPAHRRYVARMVKV